MAVVMAEAVASIHQLFDAQFNRIGHETSSEIEKAKSRQIESLEQALLRVLAFELAQLFARHAAAVGREVTVQLAPNGQERLLVGRSGQSGH